MYILKGELKKTEWSWKIILILATTGFSFFFFVTDMSLYSFISTDLISRLISSHFVWVLLNIPLKIFLLTVFWCFLFF